MYYYYNDQFVNFGHHNYLKILFRNKYTEVRKMWGGFSPNDLSPGRAQPQASETSFIKMKKALLTNEQGDAETLVARVVMLHPLVKRPKNYKVDSGADSGKAKL